jgi:hypothetical protein
MVWSGGEVILSLNQQLRSGGQKGEAIVSGRPDLEQHWEAGRIIKCLLALQRRHILIGLTRGCYVWFGLLNSSTIKVDDPKGEWKKMTPFTVRENNR